ncbi:AAA family ATPase [Azospirillum sp. B506]|uniref:AAA family ATPase n=1 Tax=Azospirillum sp. B506 TaxID=137721 RepID=UPI001FCB0110|nr:AAA family ATPase [Azospirillum sp. B506]
MRKNGGRDQHLAGKADSMRLEELGERICILGPSNSGKSTFASAIGRKRGLTVVHLDQLYHRPGTDWEPRPKDEFIRLHDDAITGDRWVMDGNYSVCVQQRFARATGLIMLDISMPVSLLRYFRRTWFERERLGALDGKRDSVKWGMIHHIAVVTPRNRNRNIARFDRAALPKIRLCSIRAIKECYRDWGLDR